MVSFSSNVSLGVSSSNGTGVQPESDADVTRRVTGKLDHSSEQEKVSAASRRREDARRQIHRSSDVDLVLLERSFSSSLDGLVSTGLLANN